MARESPPGLVRHFGSDPTPTVATGYEELCHIPVRLILDKDQTRQFTVHSYQERVPLRFDPVERKARITESAVRSEFYIVEFTEVMSIQLQEIRQDRFLIRRSRH